MSGFSVDLDREISDHSEARRWKSGYPFHGVTGSELTEFAAGQDSEIGRISELRVVGGRTEVAKEK